MKSCICLFKFNSFTLVLIASLFAFNLAYTQGTNEVEYNNKVREVLANYEQDKGEIRAYEPTASILLQAAKTADALKRYDGALECYNAAAKHAKKFNRFDKAIIYYNQVIEISNQQSKDQSEEARARNDLGIIYAMIGEFDLSLNEFDKSLKLTKASNNDALAIASIYLNKGGMYISSGQVQKAIAAYNNALLILKDAETKTQDNKVLRRIKNSEANIYNNVAIAYMEQKDYSNAIDNFITAKSIYVANKDYLNKLYAVNNLTQCYILKNDAQNAEKALMELESEVAAWSDKRLAAEARSNRANLEFLKGNYNKAIPIFKESITNYKNINADPNKNVIIYSKLHEAYKNIGNFEEAYNYSLLHKDAEDKLQRFETAKEMAILENQSMVDEQLQDIKFLNLTNNENAKTLRWQKIALLSLIIGIIVFSFLLLLVNRQKNQINVNMKKLTTVNETIKLQNEALNAKNNDLKEFAYVASHDLKTPLRTIGSFAGLLKMKYKDKLDAEGIEFTNFIIDGSSKLQILLDDLLKFATIGSQNLPIGKINLNEIIESVKSNLQVVIEENDAAINTSNLPTIMSSETEMIQLFQNLINNAIKFRKSDVSPIINIDSYKEADRIIININDNGIGIPDSMKDHVFNVFKRGEGTEKIAGTGIGLSICKKIIDKNGGQIWIDKKYDAGTSFKISFPKKAFTEVL